MTMDWHRRTTQRRSVSRAYPFRRRAPILLHSEEVAVSPAAWVDPWRSSWTHSVVSVLLGARRAANPICPISSGGWNSAPPSPISFRRARPPLHQRRRQHPEIVPAGRSLGSRPGVPFLMRTLASGSHPDRCGRVPDVSPNTTPQPHEVITSQRVTQRTQR